MDTIYPSGIRLGHKPILTEFVSLIPFHIEFQECLKSLLIGFARWKQRYTYGYANKKQDS